MQPRREFIRSAMQKHCPFKCFFGFEEIEELIKLKKKGDPFLYGDHAYFSRGYEKGNFRYTYNNIHQTKLLDVDGERRKIYPVTPKEWKQGDKILFIPAPKNPLSYHKELKWNEETLERLVKLTNRTIDIKKNKTNGLGNSIHNCWAIVSHSSVASVEAAIQGIRVVGPKTSPANQIGVSLDQIENPIEPDREQWINTLTYSQFNISEIQNGTAWQIIKETENL